VQGNAELSFQVSLELSLTAPVGFAMLKRAILFDIDGTLVDSNDAHVEAWQRAFAREGYSFTRREIHAQIGKGGDNLLPSLLPGVPSEILAKIDRAQGDIYRRDFLPRVEPFDGAVEALKALAERGHAIVLASSASRIEVDHYVELLDADGLLSGTTSKDDVASSKPCPDIFVSALEHTGYPSENAVVVGDTPFDVIAARRASIEAIAVLSGGFEEHELRSYRPIAIYQNVAELRANYETSVLHKELDESFYLSAV
jgi:HAD superfamily hydrolase (TIGR01509 family)